MGEPGQQSGETQKQAPAQAPAQDQTPGQASEPADFKGKKDEMIRQLENAYDKRISAGSKALSEIALTAVTEKKEQQKKEIAELFDRREKEAAEQITADRDALSRQILGTTTEEAQNKITQVESIIERSRGENAFLDDAAVAKMLEDLKGVEKLAAEDKVMQAIAEKLLNGQDIGPGDYEYIIGILNPYDIQKQAGGNKETCDATSAGIIVGFMKPEQRFKLVDLFMDSQKKAQTPVLIDSFIRTKVLTGYQAEVLLNGDAGGFRGAVQRGIITPEQYQSDFKAKFDNGFYAQEIQKYEKMMEEMMKKGPSGEYSNNIMNRVVGRPLAGGLLALWGAVLSALNIAANWSDKKSWVTNPYIYAGLAGMVAGTEIATGTVKAGTPWFGAGVIGRGIDSLSENDKQNGLKNRARDQIAQAIDPAKSPGEFIAFLDNGGYATIMDARKKKESEGDKASPIITIEDLIAAEQGKDAMQSARLANLAKLPQGIRDGVTVNVGKIAEAGVNIFNIDNSQEFGTLLADIRKSQRPQESPASPSAAPSGPATPPPTELAQNALVGQPPTAAPSSGPASAPPVPTSPPIASA